MASQILKQTIALFTKFNAMQRALILCVLAAFVLSFFFWKRHTIPEKKIEESPKIKVAPKGFELFDSNTWIKGEKELQMLELRALKGQLESEIEKFENVKSASVILDLGESRPMGSKRVLPKASVILTLHPGKFLSEGALVAITSHLVGGVRGLNPSDVAISDTAGRIYQVIGEGCSDLIGEEQLKGECQQLLNKIVGARHFHLTVGKKRISVVVDQNVISQAQLKEVIKALSLVVGKEWDVTGERLCFEKKPEIFAAKKEKTSFPPVFYLSPLLLLTLLPLFWRKKNKKESDLFNMIRKIDVDKLVDTIKKEDPHTIALLLSYLDEEKATDVIEALPTNIQEEVFAHLSAMEEASE